MSHLLQSRLRLALVLTGVLALQACGGGSSEPPDPLKPAELVDLAQAVAVYDIGGGGIGGDGDGDGGAAGAAGDGSALSNATVVLTDAAGKVITGKTDDKGHYLLRFKTAEIKAPYVLKVIDAGGNVLSSATEQSVPTGKVTRVNINPLTDKITSDVLATGVSGTDKAFTGANVETGRLGTAKANLNTSIKDALGTAGIGKTDQFDAVRSVYRYNGEGVDAIIESIGHGRDPSTGATQLRAKLAGLQTDANGVVAPTLITASTPLAPALVALPSNPALTFSKITAWINRVNECLPTTAAVPCGFSAFDTLVSVSYKHNSKEWLEDFRTLFSDEGSRAPAGSQIRNPAILYIGRYNNSTVDDLAVVEVTIRQPRVGSLAGTNPNPIEYTKTLVFKRDDTTPGLAAGNWILHGNQRNFDWSVEPQYFTFIQRNPATPPEFSRTSSAVRLFFNGFVYDQAQRRWVDAGVYAVRLKGPGLPGNGIVFAPTTTSTDGYFTLLNRTGAIPTPGTRSSRPQVDFRLAAVNYPTGAAISATAWPGNPSGNNSPVYPEVEFTDFAQLQAFSAYSLEIFRTGSSTPIVETTRILAPIESPRAYVQRPLHDLSPSLAIMQPPQPSATQVTIGWTRNPLAVRIESAYVSAYGTSSLVESRSLPDAFDLNPTSTSLTISFSPTSIPALATTPGSGREVGIAGRAARARFTQAINWGN